MQIKINREELLGRLQSVTPGLSSKEVIEQSSCFVFQSGRVMAYNDEVFCSARIKSIPKDFSGAIKAKTFLELLTKLPDDDLDLESKDAVLLVKGAGRSTEIPMEMEILLGVSAVEKPTGWTELPTEFADAVALVSACAGNDANRFSLLCVHFAPKFIEACDNTHMIRYKMKLGIEEDFLVKAKSIKNVVKLGMSEFDVTQNWVHFRNPSGITLSCRKYLEKFPDLTEAVKVKGSPATLPKGLALAADCAAIFARENDDAKMKQVKIEMKPGFMRILGEASAGRYKERKEMPSYKGDPIEFMIDPLLLVEITKRYNDCEISATRLKVDSGNFTYVTCLGKVVAVQEGE